MLSFQPPLEPGFYFSFRMSRCRPSQGYFPFLFSGVLCHFYFPAECADSPEGRRHGTSSLHPRKLARPTAAPRYSVGSFAHFSSRCKVGIVATRERSLLLVVQKYYVDVLDSSARHHVHMLIFSSVILFSSYLASLLPHRVRQQKPLKSARKGENDTRYPITHLPAFLPFTFSFHYISHFALSENAY